MMLRELEFPKLETSALGNADASRRDKVRRPCLTRFILTSGRSHWSTLTSSAQVTPTEQDQTEHKSVRGCYPTAELWGTQVSLVAELSSRPVSEISTSPQKVGQTFCLSWTGYKACPTKSKGHPYKIMH